MQRLMSGDYNRRDFIKRLAAVGFTVPAIAAFLAACGGGSSSSTSTSAASASTSASSGSSSGATPSSSGSASPAATQASSTAAATQAAAQGEGKRGGTLKVALNSDLASVDMMWGTPNVNRDVMGHVYEYLFTMSEKNTYIPMLAEKDMDISADGMTFTIPLRKGVKFHNGADFTAKDAVASLERWHRMTSRGQTIAANLDSITATDDYTVKIVFTKPNGGLLFAIGQYGGLAVMFPKDVVDKYYDATTKKDNEIKDADAIGTGPYKLKEWVRDSSITMVRNENYAARSEPTDGRGGKRYAYVDQIVFTPVQDPTTLLNGLVSGEFHISYASAPAQYDQIKSDPNLVPVIIKPGSKAVAVFNKKQGPFTDQFLRQAALAATNPVEVMAGTIDNDQFYGTFASLAGKEWGFWYTEVDNDLYNQNNIDKAKQLLAQSSYKGEKLRWITTKDYDYMYRSALVASKEWAKAGINVELVVSDWPTVVTNRSKPDAYEIFSTGIGFEGDPLGTGAYTAAWPGWTTSPEITKAETSLVTETDDAKRKTLWEDLQKGFYEEVPYIQFGEMYTLRATRKNVHNFTGRQDLMLWNVWLD
jgi:peptide/nickel transport system substrate-binding protein